MFCKLALPAVLAATLLGVAVRASPLDVRGSVFRRDNKYNLKCSNAPGVIAGSAYVKSAQLTNLI